MLSRWAWFRECVLRLEFYCATHNASSITQILIKTMSLNFSPQFNNSSTMRPTFSGSVNAAGGSSTGGGYNAQGFAGMASQNRFIGVNAGVSGGFSGSGQFGRPSPSIGISGGFRF
jgi:hypothetical protein